MDELVRRGLALANLGSLTLDVRRIESKAKRDPRTLPVFPVKP